MQTGPDTHLVTGTPRGHAPLRRLLLVLLATGALVALLASDGVAHSVDLDCADFATQRAAQNHQDTHVGDPDFLNDANGLTCPELPCPCGPTVLPPPAPTPVLPTSTAPLVLPQTTEARVARVVDASTLTVRLRAGGTARVRLLGIDAPKRRGAAARATCGAVDAARRTKQLVMRNGIGRAVRLKTDPTHDRADRFDRLLAYVEVRGVDLGRTLISSGWAKVDAASPDFLRAGTYREAQKSAQAAQRGAWRMCRSATRR